MLGTASEMSKKPLTQVNRATSFEAYTRGCCLIQLSLECHVGRMMTSKEVVSDNIELSTMMLASCMVYY